MCINKHLTFTHDIQISDFGLAKWLPENWSHHVVFPIEGTFGLDPTPVICYRHLLLFEFYEC